MDTLTESWNWTEAYIINTYELIKSTTAILNNMNGKSYKVLSVFYFITAILLLAVLWFGWMWDHAVISSWHSWADLAYVGAWGLVAILLLIGAIEAWRVRIERTILQKAFVWAPLVLPFVALILCVIIFAVVTLIAHVAR